MTGWTTPPTFTGTDGTVVHDSTFQILSDDLVAINGYKIKTADESVTSSTALQNDNHLTYTIVAPGTYIIQAHLIVKSATNAAGDIAIGATWPTGTCHFFTIAGLDATLASGNTGTAQGRAIPGATSGASLAAFGCSTTETAVIVEFHLIATATGTFTLQWAQNSSSASATTVVTGSFLTVQQKV